MSVHCECLGGRMGQILFTAARVFQWRCLLLYCWHSNEQRTWFWHVGVILLSSAEPYGLRCCRLRLVSTTSSLLLPCSTWKAQPPWRQVPCYQSADAVNIRDLLIFLKSFRSDLPSTNLADRLLSSLARGQSDSCSADAQYTTVDDTKPMISTL